MRVQWAIPVLASVLILGFLGTSEDAFAPKKLFVGGLSWNTDTQEFVLELLVHHGIANAGEKSGKFCVDGVLTIFPDSPDEQGKNFFNCLDDIPNDGFRDEDGFVSYFIGIPWDRNGGTVEGSVDVSGSFEFGFQSKSNSSSEIIEIDDVVLVGATSEGCSTNDDCDDGQFCNGSETCDAALDCQSGTAPDIDDGVACTDDSCDEVTDTIVHNADACNGDPIPPPADFIQDGCFVATLDPGTALFTVTFTNPQGEQSIFMLDANEFNTNLNALFDAQASGQVEVSDFTQVGGETSFCVTIL